MSINPGGPADLGGIVDKKAYEIMMKGYGRQPMSKKECSFLLGFPDHSSEAYLVRMLANDLVRKASGNMGIIAAQFGVMVGPCPGRCNFCNFNADYTKANKFEMTDDELRERLIGLAEFNDVCTVLLMSMHKYDLDRLLEMVRLTRRTISEGVRISVNIGDTNYDSCVELKQAGVDVGYHVCRLREGTDTSLRPQDRLQTIRNMQNAGIAVSTCCEPIGPEHSVEEIVDNFFLGVEMGCVSLAVMKRVAVPGTPLARHGIITDARLAQMAAVFSLATASSRKLPSVNVHESSVLGFLSGANLLTAEYGGNPRDVLAKTEAGRGMSTAACRRMLFEAGFDKLLRGDGKTVRLDMDYLRATGSI